MNGDLFGEGHGRSPARRAPERAGLVTDRAKPLTVTGVNALARGLLESSYPPLWVAGEVTGWKRTPSTGHCYFTLKDRTALLRCVMFRDDALRLPAMPEEGMQVRVQGTLTLYEQRGDFQLKVRVVEAEGTGGLYRIAFERLRGKLEAEGLLASARKRALPRFPGTVGVITSPIGAALHDILTVLERRAPWTRVLFSPAKVQGEGAAADIARAIRLFSRTNEADVLIVGRGGGSVEDLWAFNEEVVARAIASSPIPVVSAVGHEVDVTIADLVADARAATPSAAAECVVPDPGAIEGLLERAEYRLVSGLRRTVERPQRRLDVQVARMETAMTRRLGQRQSRMAAIDGRLESAMGRLLRRREDRLASLAGRLEALSPLAALRRGYAVPLAEDGTLLRSHRDFETGSSFRLRIADGSVDCSVEGVRPEEQE